MNKMQKKALYENIMRSVSKTIKKRLNEDKDYEDFIKDADKALYISKENGRNTYTFFE